MVFSDSLGCLIFFSSSFFVLFDLGGGWGGRACGCCYSGMRDLYRQSALRRKKGGRGKKKKRRKKKGGQRTIDVCKGGPPNY